MNIVKKFCLTVEKFENDIAIKTTNESLTYKELDIESDKVAYYLHKNGLKKGEFVSIYLQRSVDTVISILGILKAGGVYVPLDPKHPKERNTYIIEDTNSPFILTDSKYKKELANMKLSSEIICIESLKEFTKISLDISPDDTAYVIYTSGTTGNPKGALIHHKGVINLVDWVYNTWKIENDDVVLQFATYSFDASVIDTFSSLLKGSTLFIISDEERVSEENFIKVINTENITIIPALPNVLFSRVVNYSKDNNINKLGKVKALGVGGELLTFDLFKNFRECFGGTIRFFNLYGPTESTVVCSAYETPSKVDNNENIFSVPIGKEISETKLYIVNEEGNLCEKGEIGELWIASVGLSQGYLNNKKKTKEVFIKNPFDNIFGGKVYKSGDLVKYKEDGNIEFIDRKDTQVKIRGHRIEIGEIESKLNMLEEIHNSIVVVEENENDKILKAFYTSKEYIDKKDIIKYLKEKIPSYMIPSKLSMIDKIPFTPTGKVDRKLLALKEAEKIILTDEIIHPRNEVEKNIVNAWKEVLKVDNIGIKEDFFEIGGHSLKIIEVLAQLKRKYRNLSISDFFELRTVEKLAIKAYQNNFELEKEIKENEFKYLKEYPILKVKENLKEDVNSVLLTGATGFLGSHILKKLVDNNIKIYLLVRGRNPKSRIESILKEYFGLFPIDTIQIINGDLTDKYLGMTENEFNELAGNINAIIHCAADVRHFGDRNHFEKINVLGTKNIIELLDKNQNIVFHHISTIGISQDLLSEGKWDKLEKNIESINNLTLDNIYTDTKLKAEKIVLDKINEGKNAFIYRMGNLTGRSDDGKFQKNIESNAFYRMMKLMILLKKAPKVNWLVDVTPVDFASDIVMKGVMKKIHTHRVYNVSHPNPIHFESLVDLFNEVGFEIDLIDKMSYEEYALNNKLTKEAKDLLVSQLDGDGAIDSRAVFDSSKTMRELNIAVKDVPIINKELIDKLLSEAERVGFIDYRMVLVR
ncbi:amino acid adenylation domain-containing protein [Bacillus spongiae]|uniref:Amino acid adenylation domain-containing protein n=1 Tax=Bacillus spongiae TaxID=2683610 RepID=A0ABU8HAK7_9BACI